MHRKILAGASVLVLSLTAACGGSSSDDGGGGGGAGGAYKWGLNAEISGPLAFYGETIRDGVKAYVDQVNADGGIDGHKIDLTIVDSGGDAARAATNTTQLATSKGVNAIFGNTLSANCSAATPNAVKYKVPMACLSVAEPGEWVYSMGPNNARAAGPAIAAAQEVSGKDDAKLASVYVNTLTSIAMGKAIKSQASGAGVDLVADEEIDIASTDYSAAISKVVKAKPDAISISASGPGFVSFLKGVRAAGLNAPILWIDGAGNISSIENIDDPALFAFGTYQLVDVKNTEGTAKEYLDAVSPNLKEVTNSSVANGNTAVAYLTAKAWGGALKKCGYPCSGADLQKQLDGLTVDLSTMVPDFAYKKGDHYPYPTWTLTQVRKGSNFTPINAYPTDPTK